jgi:hypothetical protein
MNGNSSSAVSTATRSALNFLLDAQDSEGAWRDFLLPSGHSNVWVTAFVGGVVASFPETSAQKAALAGWRFLERAVTPDGGWSYNPTVPGDADSTLWGLRLAEALGLEDSECLRRANSFLELHTRDDGGIATYASATPVRSYIHLPAEVSFEGWTSQSHVCVTASCANLRSYQERFQNYLLQQQTEEGKWPAYWWFDEEFSTAEAVAALVGKGRTVAECDAVIAARVERAAGWALRRCEVLSGAGGSGRHTFALAHILRILARAEQSPEVRGQLLRVVAQLIEWQKPDGSWPVSARLRVPRPETIVPDAKEDWKMWAGMPAVMPSVENILKHTFSIYSPDHFGVYTTATTLRALHETALSDGH